MEEIIGLDLSSEKMEIRGLRIHPEFRSQEPARMRSRWFDYRGMHPVAATYLYAHYYVQQTRKFCAEVVDYRSAEEARAFTPDDIFMSRDLTSMWCARGAADSLGVPYPFALQFAHARFLERQQRLFPRPNQLYGETFEDDLKSAWNARLAVDMTYSTAPQYRASSIDPADPTTDQQEHLSFVMDQVLARPRPHAALLARLFNENVLTPELARSRFTAQEVAAAEAYCAKFY